jgi:hypothetical protein
MDQERATESEPAGAVQQAAAMLVGLPGERRRLPAIEEIRAAASEADVHQGVGTVLLGLMGTVAEDPALRLDLVPALLRQLQREAPGVPADVIANVGGALVAAAFGLSPTRWRRGNTPWVEDDRLPVSAAEAFAWAMVTRLLVEFIDDAHGEGTVADLLDEWLVQDRSR